MRILRGRSNLEVSSQGFAWFVVGLVLATFLGGAVRTILSSERVHKRIITELRNRFPKHSFNIGQTNVLLSNGLWPGLGLSLENVHFTQDVCDKLSFDFNVPQVILPVDLLSLRQGTVRLGKVELIGGRLHLDYRPCEVAAGDSNQEADAAGATPIKSIPKKPPLSTEALDWKKLRPFADGAVISELEITYEPQSTWKLAIQEMDLSFKDELSAHGLWILQKSLPFGEASFPLELNVQGDDRVIQWKAQSEFKEGRLNLNGSLDLASQVSVIQVNTRQLPVKDVAFELVRIGALDAELALKPSWFTCALKWEGDLNRVLQMPVNVRECRFEGGYGRIEVDHADVWLDGSGFLKTPARVRIDRLQLQAVVEIFKRKLLPAILTKIGVWSGELRFQNPNEWSLDGFLDRADVVFSHRSVRGKQVIEKLHTSFKKEGSVIGVEIDRMAIQGGEFKGLIRARLNDDWRNGSFETEIQNLTLHPSIQSILVGGELGKLGAKGKGILQAGEVSHWAGALNLEKVSGPGWGAEAVVIDSRYQPGVFSLNGRARRVKAEQGWPAYSQLVKVYPTAGSQVAWQDVRAKAEIERGGGTIQQVVGLESVTRQLWKFKGSWVRDGQLNGELSVGTSGQRVMVRGERGVLSVVGP